MRTVNCDEVNFKLGSAAIVAAAKIAMPPRTIELRILDSEGHEVISRQRADRSGKRT